ncbi:hypothetical protein Q8A67_016943 [Cirrhinus molitorella]|uniref:Uncharacterized protein n=1 Tax=Cirrhinus molitorella TaxID=172907 RepID=A0AA88PKW9_9TELE|nr:hypothetical protein Q8A67_016943 [Cirrhinus molitorella]
MQDLSTETRDFTASRERGDYRGARPKHRTDRQGHGSHSSGDPQSKAAWEGPRQPKSHRPAKMRAAGPQNHQGTAMQGPSDKPKPQLPSEQTVNEITAPVAINETNDTTMEEPYPGFEAQVQQILKDADAIQDETDLQKLRQILYQYKADYNFTLSPELEMKIAEGGPQLIDITPIDQALQALGQMPALTNLPVVRSWTAADTALCLSTAIGYALTLGLAFILYRKVNEMQESVGRCTAAFPRTFERQRREKSTPAEPEVTLIEIDTLPAHHSTEDK